MAVFRLMTDGFCSLRAGLVYNGFQKFCLDQVLVAASVSEWNKWFSHSLTLAATRELESIPDNVHDKTFKNHSSVDRDW